MNRDGVAGGLFGQQEASHVEGCNLAGIGYAIVLKVIDELADEAVIRADGVWTEAFNFTSD